MSKPKKNFKEKSIEDFVDEKDDKKSIILILIGIVVVIGLIIASVFLFDKEEKAPEGNEQLEIKEPNEVSEEIEESKENEKLAIVKKITVKYLDHDGNQLGKTQRVLALNDKVNEKAPKIDGFRFAEWIESYDKENDIYYFIASYVPNVERIPVVDEPYLDEEDGETEDTYVAEIVEINNPEDPVIVDGEVQIDPETEEEILYTNPTYEVEITGEVEELEPEDIDDDLTISEDDYSHILGLRFNAPEDITKEDIEKMTINVKATNPGENLSEDQYHYNGEDLEKTGRELLDSTDEEYENDIFYFYYYQEADTRTNTTLEVYWGNAPEADSDAEPLPIEPKDEYVEVYDIKLDEVELENEVLEK